jgi:glycosyltransferase involved in cell wall biosynthesis
MFSTVILTLNEERDLPRCLASIRDCTDVVVLDSGSTDGTARLARASGARVIVRPFDNFAGQRNYAQGQIPFQNKWVFHLDADEAMTPELVEECIQASQRDDVDGMLVAPKMMFNGHWIPHCTDFPAYQARFARAPEFRFIQVGHGQREAPEMKTVRMRHNYYHDLTSGGEAEWLDKHRRYARAEAAEHFANTSKIPWAHFISRQSLIRRRALKRLSYHLPARPCMRFLYQYFLKCGFLDGRAGLRYCRLLARYEGYTVEELGLLKKRARR